MVRIHSPDHFSEEESYSQKKKTGVNRYLIYVESPALKFPTTLSREIRDAKDKSTKIESKWCWVVINRRLQSNDTVKRHLDLILLTQTCNLNVALS